MVILDFEYSELDKEIDYLCESGKLDDYMGEAIVTKNVADGDLIVVYEPAFRITDKNVIAIEGVYYAKDEDTNRLESDWSLTLIYKNVEDSEFDADNWIYFESGGVIASAVYNYLNFINSQKGSVKK